MSKNSALKIAFAGIAGGFAGNGILGALFSAPFIKAILYNSELQSKLYIELTPQRNIPVSVAGLVILSVVHSWLFNLLMPSIPGNTWVRKGLFWGLAICLMYWLFQEWFMFNALLREPLLLCLLEMVLLLIGSIVEGVVIAFFLARKS